MWHLVLVSTQAPKVPRTKTQKFVKKKEDQTSDQTWYLGTVALVLISTQAPKVLGPKLKILSKKKRIRLRIRLRVVRSAKEQI
jgi:hypothetical protein